ncbi:MAG: hypothetical protein JNK11_09735, partial [Alphaproteobacteria bacterium]|nr:hypothetical protein [Alphaproteobacteria bacterium]
MRSRPGGGGQAAAIARRASLRLIAGAGMLAPAACEYASALGKEAARLLPLQSAAEQPRAAPAPVAIRRPSVQLDDARLLALRSLSASGAEGLAWHDAILREAGTLLRAPLLERRFEPRRPVLLPTSRAALDRLRLLGIAHMLSGDDDYVARAVAEIEVVCAFPDWNPSHFLDVAEMAHGVALAYDWLHQRLAPELRRAVRTALVEKALRPGLEQFARGAFWTKASHNWNTVCNAGLAIAALAVRDDEPDLAVQVLDRALRSAALSFASFAPDGGWIEGVSYWDYATRYAVALLDALATAGVPDRGLAQAPGFAATGRFALHMTGPSGRVYNFADSSERLGRLAQLHWLGARFGRPIDAHVARTRPGAPQPMELVWRAAAPGIAPAAAGEPLDALFAGVQVASFRSAWDDPAGVWLACKGGDNAANHAHLDLGSFVVEAAG